MTQHPSTQGYLDRLPEDQRQALERLRDVVIQAVPEAEEAISYGLPAFRLRGKALLAFGATANHCALYPMAPEIIERFADELAGFSTSKGTIRFQPTAPLPDALIRRIAIARAETLGD